MTSPTPTTPVPFRSVTRETAWGVETFTVWGAATPPVSLFHVGRCEHEHVETEPSDRSVGHYGGTYCADCGADLTDDDRYAPDPDGDYADRYEDDRWECDDRY